MYLDIFSGNETCIDLIKLLQNRLNDAVLDVLSILLFRNPQCRLFLDDVQFIQPVGGPFDFTLKVS